MAQDRDFETLMRDHSEQSAIPYISDTANLSEMDEIAVANKVVSLSGESLHALIGRQRTELEVNRLSPAQIEAFKAVCNYIADGGSLPFIEDMSITQLYIGLLRRQIV